MLLMLYDTLALQDPPAHRQVPVASNRQSNKRAKVTHEEDAVLVPLQHAAALETCKPSAHVIAAAATPEIAATGSAVADVLGHVEQNVPHSCSQTLPKQVLQAKGVAPHIIVTADVGQSQSVSATLRVLNQGVQSLVSVFRQAVATAVSCAADGMNVVAVDIQIGGYQSLCHILCHQTKLLASLVEYVPQ